MPDTPAWRVVIPAHAIPRRTIGGVAVAHAPYQVAAVDTISYESTRRLAVEDVVQTAHIDAGIPPWKPYLRITRQMVVATPVTVSAATGVMSRLPQD